MGSLAVSRLEPADRPPRSIADDVAAIARKELAPLAAAIDGGEVYPDALLRRFGEVGAWSSHVPENGAADLRCAIQSIAAIGEVCGATAFMAWCQNTLVWYAANADNPHLAAKFADSFASGRILGGTGLSNPMKSFFGIERLKLKGRKVEGGYVVRGALPWVSNLGPDHYFGTIFEREDAPGEIVMFLADCADPAVTLQPCKPFLAMDGTGTYGVQFRDAFVPDDLILAAPAAPFVKKIRAGFILLQAGMALGLIKDCIGIMDAVEAPLGHVNRYLPQQPVQFKELFAELERESMALARDPYNTEGRRPSPARGRCQCRRRACRDAPLRRARLSQEPPRAATPARGLFRRHRHAGHQAASQDAGRRLSFFEVHTNLQPQPNRRGLP
jgi:Acyl-CoA dehydrogenase, N-terminal domain